MQARVEEKGSVLAEPYVVERADRRGIGCARTGHSLRKQHLLGPGPQGYRGAGREGSFCGIDGRRI